MLPDNDNQPSLRVDRILQGREAVELCGHTEVSVLEQDSTRE